MDNEDITIENIVAYKMGYKSVADIEQTIDDIDKELEQYECTLKVGKRFSDEAKEEREKFLNWLWDFEFKLYGIPVPNEVFFLKMPPEKALDLIKNRENKFTHTDKKDIHERDSQHIIDSYNAACDVAEKYNWYTVECVKEGNIRTIEDIHKEIYNELKKHL